MNTKSLKILFFLLFSSIVICTGQTDKTISKDIRYVIAPNGLSLRKENTLKSEKIAVMPLASKLILLEEATEKTIEVENSKGGMHKVSFNGVIGYCFSEYLSQLYLPKKDQAVEAYLTELKEYFPSIKLESKETPEDFHEGYIDTYILPASGWHEIFYLIRGIYQLPKSFSYPSPSGPAQETIEEPNKPKEVWSSLMVFNRTADDFENITYAYRAEGFGYSVEITSAENGFFNIKYLIYVD